MEFQEIGSKIFFSDDVLPATFCADMIRRFEEDSEKVQSVVGHPPRVDKRIRDTMELAISQLPRWADVDEVMQKIVSEAFLQLARQFPGLRQIKVSDQGYWILRYEPGAQYVKHCDWNSTSRRQLAFILYLNTSDGGTQFDSVTVEARQGRLVAFPPFWTHEHAGLPPTKERKYCLVTWLCF